MNNQERETDQCEGREGCFHQLPWVGLVVASALMFGGWQAYVEQRKIGTPEGLEKYPNGWESYNVTSEMIEGALPAAVGAMVGLYIANKFIDGMEDPWMFRLLAISIGAVGGYLTMVSLGYALHHLLGVSDLGLK